jgi:hypothetical protein
MPRANRHYLPGHIWHITHRYRRNFVQTVQAVQSLRSVQTVEEGNGLLSECVIDAVTCIGFSSEETLRFVRARLCGDVQPRSSFG